jgi:hypothetical protein
MRDRPRASIWPLAFITHRPNSQGRAGYNQILPNEANFKLCGICRHSSNMDNRPNEANFNLCGLCGLPIRVEI